jgi:hypothetical protein
VKHLYLILLPVLLVACSKSRQNAPATLQQPTIIKDTSGLYFMSAPVSATELQFTFPTYPAPFATITLRGDAGILEVFPITPLPMTGFAAAVTYPFQPGKRYSFTVETVVNHGLGYRYILPPYIHTYVAPFTWQELLSFTQRLGYDISPSRNILYAMDDAQNTLTTEKLSLMDGTITPISSMMNTYSHMIRAVNDSEILAVKGYASGTSDSSLLYRLNTNTGAVSNVAFVSTNYARYSRIIDNHILTTLPLFPGNAELIDLGDNSKRIYSVDSINFSLVGETNFDHIFYYNQIVNPITGTLTTLLSPGNDSAAVILIDSATQYLFLGYFKDLTTVPPNIGSYKTSFSVYSGNQLLYKDSFVTNREEEIPKQALIINNQLLFNQSFGWDTTYHISGYYRLDLNSKTMTLIHCRPAFEGDDFQLSPHTMISVQAGGVYKITIP